LILLRKKNPRNDAIKKKPKASERMKMI